MGSTRIQDNISKARSGRSSRNGTPSLFTNLQGNPCAVDVVYKISKRNFLAESFHFKFQINVEINTAAVRPWPEPPRLIVDPVAGQPSFGVDPEDSTVSENSHRIVQTTLDHHGQTHRADHAFTGRCDLFYENFHRVGGKIRAKKGILAAISRQAKLWQNQNLNTSPTCIRHGL